ncbi:acyl-CoA dehydrogenase [Agrobacterium rhizogenes]|nr:acyl-CoA dehydrogenase [Rhizobium rhizogenes]NTI98384.1 acyl-CoA dehydrogenase [Rhizobium rhizogenes]NTJ60812.1 acyl-CoA dehydrogenase [Rhizobium rhizogenes]
MNLLGFPWIMAQVVVTRKLIDRAMTFAARAHSEFPLPVVLNSPELERFLEHVKAGASERDRNRQLPFDVVALIRQNRIGAIRLPLSAGGAGASFRQLLAFVVELAAADPNVAHILRNHFCFVELFAQPRVANSEKWTKLVAGGSIFGLAAGELGVTVGAGLVSTTISREPSGLRVNGAKCYSTGSLYSDHILVRAAWEDGPKASVILPTDRKGVTIEDDWDGIGQRLTGSGSTFLKDVVAHDEEIFPDAPEEGYRPAYSTTLGHLIVTAIAAGVVRAAAAEAKDLIARRKRGFAHAPTPEPTQDPILLQTLGEISSAAFAAEAIVLAAADALDAVDAVVGSGKRADDEAHAAALAASKAKVVVDGLALRAASSIFDVGGASATSRAENLDRHWRNIRTLISHNPASYKALAVGALELHSTPLPDNGFF